MHASDHGLVSHRCAVVQILNRYLFRTPYEVLAQNPFTELDWHRGDAISNLITTMRTLVLCVVDKGANSTSAREDSTFRCDMPTTLTGISFLFNLHLQL